MKSANVFGYKTMSIIFLVLVLLISLALSGYSHLVSSSAATLPKFVYEGMEEMDANVENKKENEKKENEETSE